MVGGDYNAAEVTRESEASQYHLLKLGGRADFRFRISDCGFKTIAFQSAIYNPHSAIESPDQLKQVVLTKPALIVRQNLFRLETHLLQSVSRLHDHLA